ncbi:MAG TPA: hypothetical protein VFZ85_07985 [Jiangellaceae bacterium]
MNQPSLSDMTPEERIAAMDMRTLPNGKTIGHAPVGVDWTMDDLPDFIGAMYGGGKIGYVHTTDAFADEFEPPPETDEEALARTMQRLREGPRTIPVFADDGETVIGEKVVGGGQAIGERQDGTTVTYDFGKGTITTVTPDGQTTVENVRE